MTHFFVDVISEIDILEALAKKNARLHAPNDLIMISVEIIHLEISVGPLI